MGFHAGHVPLYAHLGVGETSSSPLFTKKIERGLGRLHETNGFDCGAKAEEFNQSRIQNVAMKRIKIEAWQMMSCLNDALGRRYWEEAVTWRCDELWREAYVKLTKGALDLHDCMSFELLLNRMSDTTDTMENKREDEHSDRAIDVCHLVLEWRLRGTRDDPLTDGTRTGLNENVTMKIFGNFGDEPTTKGHADLLDFGGLLIEARVRCLTSRGRYACSAESGQSSHASTARTLLQFEENDAVTTVLAYNNSFQYPTAEIMECSAECNAPRTMMIVTVPAYINNSRNRSEVVTQVQDKVLNKQLQNYEVSFFENLYYHKDEVRAFAAAAITITYRDTYTFDKYMSDTGNA